MAGGGKGGSQTTEVKIPEWLETAAKANLGRADDVAQTGYVPYYGPDIAAFGAGQNAAMQNTNSAASAFGMAGGSGGMPAPQQFAGGVSGYSSGGLYDQALAELKARNPGQFNHMAGMFINPQTGAQPTNPAFQSQAQRDAAAAAAAAAAPAQPTVAPNAIPPYFHPNGR